MAEHRAINLIHQLKRRWYAQLGGTLEARDWTCPGPHLMLGSMAARSVLSVGIRTVYAWNALFLAALYVGCAVSIATMSASAELGER